MNYGVRARMFSRCLALMIPKFVHRLGHKGSESPLTGSENEQ